MRMESKPPFRVRRAAFSSASPTSAPCRPEFRSRTTQPHCSTLGIVPGMSRWGSTMNDTEGIQPQPERRLLGTRSEYLSAFDELASRGRRELRVFDPDCVQLDLNAPARAE